MIPQRFIRVWIGENPIPEQHEIWWDEFQQIHPDYEFLTLTNFDSVNVPSAFIPIINSVDTKASQSDILRMLALHDIGGIYVDTDVMPIRSFETLRQQGRPFLGQRSKKAFEIAVMGSPKKHPAFATLLKALPAHFEQHKDRKASVATGPAFYSSVLFGRPDVLHCRTSTFYPYDGWGAPSRPTKELMFSDKKNFPPNMLAAHFSEQRWGGKSKLKL